MGALGAGLAGLGFHFWCYDPRRRASYAVPGVYSLLDIEPPADGWLAETAWLWAISPADRNRVVVQARGLRRGAPQRFLYRIARRRGGVTRWVEAFAIPYGDGRARRVVGFLREASGDPGAPGVAVGVSDLRLAGVLHDLRCVLQSVATNAELIAAADPCPRQSAASERILRATTRGAEIISRLQWWAAPPRRRAHDPADLTAILRAVREDMRARTGAAIDIRLSVDQAIPAADLPSAEIETALLNILDNACDALPDGGRVEIRARRIQGCPDDWLVIDVADDGTGMDRATMRRALDPFYTTKAPGKGAGLGLPLARELAERHGGSLTLRSARGAGTTVTLRLPLAGDPGPAGASGGRQDPPPRPVIRR
jgi:signal transduction histidine kinase